MEKEYSWKYLQINRGKNIVFDPQEIPWLKTPSTLSDLDESISVAKKFRDTWPAITFNKACLVDGAVLIQYLKAEFWLTQSVKLLNEISTITLQVVDGLSLTQDMLILIKNSGVLNTNPLIVYPGNGATSVKRFLALTDRSFAENSIYLPTQRTMLQNGKFRLDVDYSSIPKDIDQRTALIIDDVVASGQTAQTVCKEIKTRFPNIKCVLATWLLLRPTKPENKASPSGVDGVDQTIAAAVLKGNLTSRPPINSLSCFIRNENQYEEMKANFIKKYITDENSFRQLLEIWKEKQYE